MKKETAWTLVEAAAKRSGFKHYNDYLQSNHWNGLRRSKLHEESKCCVCSASEPLAVHHVNYNELLDVTLADLEVLCMGCHEVFHMACRQQKLHYIGMARLEITRVVTEFRATAWCQKWLRKRVKKKERPAKSASTPKSTLKKAYRYCGSSGFSVESLERLKAVCDLLIANKQLP